MQTVDHHLALLLTAIVMGLVNEKMGVFGPMIAGMGLFIMCYLVFYYTSWVARRVIQLLMKVVFKKV